MAFVFNVDAPQAVPAAALRQMSMAHIDPYTNYVAWLMFKDFPLSIKGGRNFSSCVSNLPSVETPDERFSFGWGPQNVIQVPQVHKDGYEHLAIMSALSSTFHEPYAAEICHAYAAEMATGDDVLPHMQQWRNHLRTFCGLLTASSFAQLVEDYIRLDPFSVGPGSNLMAVRCRVNPVAMAKGLRAMSSVVVKKESQITLVGGAVIGWFAALAEWFYDLRVAILSRTGATLYGDAHDDTTQVVLVYHEQPDLEVMDGHWSTIQERSKNDDDPFWTRHCHFLPFGGRVIWQALLPQVFGHAFWVLDHEEASTLATIIGSAARSLENDDSKTDEKANHNDGPEGSHGANLIQNITAWLPELRKNQGRMERQLKRSPHEAAKVYQSHVGKLQRICNCSVCSTIESTTAPRDGYCLPTICETIIALGLAISRMVVAAGIYPTRQGVQSLYTSQAERRRESKHLTQPHEPQEANSNHNHEGDHHHHHDQTIYSNHHNAPLPSRLQTAVELFSGTRPEHDLPDSLIALAHEGICASSTQLLKHDRRPHSGGHDDDDDDDEYFGGPQTHIQISSGAVNLRQKLFFRVCSRPVDLESSPELMAWEEVKLEYLTNPIYCR